MTPNEPLTVKMDAQPIPPVNVAIIGTGDGGTPLTTGTVAVTPDHQPNIVATIVTPFVAVFVRFLNQFLTTLVGLVGAGMMSPKLLPATDFYHLVLTCAGLSIAGAGFGFLKDLVTIFGRLEGKYPLLTGSV
jgi:hypothetical protein